MIHLVDPCADLELDIVKPKIFIDQSYFLRDPELKYSWTQDSLIWQNTDVNCGNLTVNFTMRDGSEINRDIFKIDNQAFIVPYTEDTSLQGLYEIKFQVYI